ncbi:MAG: hypothetical protein BJ554DRAFT_5380, partial [Olpidium bornovanus]
VISPPLFPPQTKKKKKKKKQVCQKRKKKGGAPFSNMSKADDDVKAVDLENQEDTEDVDFSKLKKKKKKSKPLPAGLDDRPAAAVPAPAEAAAPGTTKDGGSGGAAGPTEGEQTEDLDAMFGELSKFSFSHPPTPAPFLRLRPFLPTRSRLLELVRQAQSSASARSASQSRFCPFPTEKKKKKKVTIEGVDDGTASPAEAAEGEFEGLKKKKSGKKKSTMAEFEEALKDEDDEFGASGITFGEGDDDHEG